MTGTPEPGRPGVFLDRDGTLMEEVNYCGDPAHVKVFSGATEALARLKRKGFALIVITNQSGIGRGRFTQEEYGTVHRELLRQLGDGLLDAAYFCPDHPDALSARRKPQPGMVFEAQREHGIDLRRSFFVGDKAIDVECGKAAGVRTILVQTGYGASVETAGEDWVARDLAEAADIILANANG